MIYNYLKLMIRNFMNDRLYTFIIVSGLAVGLACCLMIAQYIHFELSFDKDVKDGIKSFTPICGGSHLKASLIIFVILP
jgi:putative ABC transport system permease protein